VVRPIRHRHRDVRPGPEWHAHGVTTKRVWVLASLSPPQLARVELLKQRWRHRESGRTRHDRPAWDVPGSPYGLDVVFFVLGCWLLAVTGLHATDWPWPDERPARRSVQRWLRRFAQDADTWRQAVRLATIELAAPRPLEEILPTGGIPPPEGRTRCHRVHAPACKLRGVAWFLESAAQSFSISIRSLLVAAQRRWTEATLTTGRSALP